MIQWMEGEVRQFKVRIIDPKWSMTNESFLIKDGLKWRELDNRKLVFKGKFRPAAGYLYSHYCLCEHGERVPGQHAAFALHEEMGKPIWATPGRCIPETCCWRS